ncbi:hypothetical protein JG687_00007467 [Phytophthora cactorum]|uniref:START domain-containing protein n=1 Tax=Phytophthora cactorum TaxID=29920 RepID=A0A8T1UHD9_9STRA|nr:hypothetical protein JG687_00007467 [Phytophthora cactorum]
MNATGDGTSRNAAVQDAGAVQTCLYCANLKALRDLLPPKRCDYCRKWRCQFCTLKFPLLGARSDPVPAEYKLRLHEMKETLAYYLSDECPWKMVKTTKGGAIYEMTANKTPFALFKIEVFITGISMDKFLAFLDSKDPKDRYVWDLNEANFEVIETFDSSDLDEDADVSVCVNTQKPFLGGLVAPRDFCLLNVATENSICFSSVEHPDVPVRPGTTRGHIFFSCFYCEEDARVEGPEGFLLTYICQTDIGGNLPAKLLYNGTMDNMQKMTKVFLQANNLFSR